LEPKEEEQPEVIDESVKNEELKESWDI
jgi:hypothetical protein